MPDGDAFTKAQEPDTPPERFDLQRWIKRGAMRPVKRCEVYLAAGLQAQIQELDAQITAAKGAAVTDERLASAAPLTALARKVEDLRAEMTSSLVAFRFRGLDVGEGDKVKAAAGLPDDDPDFAYWVLAAQCLEPAGLTWTDFRDLHLAVGDGYYVQTVLRAAAAARDGTSVDVPFSYSASAILRTSGSSES